MSRYKCLTCRSIINDKYIHARRTDPPHKKYIQIGLDGEEELSPTTKWTQELMTDELAGMKRVMLKLETHHAIQELSSQRSAATYDEILIEALEALKIQRDIGPQTLDSIVNDSIKEEE